MTQFLRHRSFAVEMDKKDPLAEYRNRFYIPQTEDGDTIYLCGNSLGLQPDHASAYVMQELEDWQKLGVEGHIHARHPWLPYHEFLAENTARLVGALPSEVVVMNSLTVNLHLLLVSFYRPNKQRYKILIEADAFPSDRYAVSSQVKFHGHNPNDAIVVWKPRGGEKLPDMQRFKELLERHGDSIATILVGGVNYYTGQLFDLEEITKLGHEYGINIGFDLAHAAGNVVLNLHDWQVDFACWCSYKYLNAGPGGLSGIFVHEKHGKSFDLPRFAGWWSHNNKNRFEMVHPYDPLTGAEGWQLSNPPILPLATLRASMDLFDEIGMPKLRAKSVQLTSYLEFLIKGIPEGHIEIITPTDPEQRGAQLSLAVHDADKRLHEAIAKRGVISDWREPDVIRIAPVPLYNSFEDCWRFAEILKEEIHRLYSNN